MKPPTNHPPWALFLLIPLPIDLVLISQIAFLRPLESRIQAALLSPSLLFLVGWGVVLDVWSIIKGE